MMMIYFSGTIIPEKPPSLDYKYIVFPTGEQFRMFNLYIFHHELSDAGIYKCEVESDSIPYAAESDVKVFSKS